ncbi:hypothetical protein ACIA8K_25825 [Catenuloplanes sp. NPDC051500]|uniref:hypothetical protein n=1 Tax=Catenuloplanes sp. NPDC051500 TaxID=3363959 RepID=UPI003793490E
MGEYPGLSVELEQLVQHAENRYEDAAICSAIRQYIIQVGEIPNYVWGTMPWVGRWQADWRTGRGFRVTEAAAARDGIARIASGLHQVAVDYHGCDIAIATDFAGKMDASSAALRPYLNALQQAPPNVARPGGDVVPPTYYSGPAVTPAYDLNTPEGQRLDRVGRSGGLNTPEFKNPGTVTQRERDREYYGDTPGFQELWKFMNEHYEVLTQAENMVDEYGPGLAKYPSRDFIDEAKGAWPRVIKERADLISVAAQNYREMREEYRQEVTNLRQSWSSPTGSGAYYTAAVGVINYLDQLDKQAQWLSDEGKKAGDLVDNLMLAYARAGYERIGIIIKHVQDLLAEADAFSPDLDKPLKALTDILTALANVMLISWNASNEAAKSLLNLAQTAATNAPDSGSAGHGAVPFPNPEGGDSWRETQWKPEPASAAPIIPAS